MRALEDAVLAENEEVILMAQYSGSAVQDIYCTWPTVLVFDISQSQIICLRVRECQVWFRGCSQDQASFSFGSFGWVGTWQSRIVTHPILLIINHKSFLSLRRKVCAIAPTRHRNLWRSRHRRDMFETSFRRNSNVYGRSPGMVVFVLQCIGEARPRYPHSHQIVGTEYTYAVVDHQVWKQPYCAKSSSFPRRFLRCQLPPCHRPS
jgi:hypothetical protein